MTKRLPVLQRIVKFPSISVMVPLVVPFSSTLAPITGSPLASTIFPCICCACCCSLDVLTVLKVVVSAKDSVLPISNTNAKVVRSLYDFTLLLFRSSFIKD